MIFVRKRQCVVCGFYSRKVQKIWGHYWCLPCEKQIVEDQCQEHEERGWEEWERVSNQSLYGEDRK